MKNSTTANTAWSPSLPRSWKYIRKRALIRDRYKCTASDYDGDKYIRCPMKATDVDHIHGRINHDLSNLQSLCRYHHQLKNGYDLNKKIQYRRTQTLNREEVHPFYV